MSPKQEESDCVGMSFNSVVQQHQRNNRPRKRRDEESDDGSVSLNKRRTLHDDNVDCTSNQRLHSDPTCSYQSSLNCSHRINVNSNSSWRRSSTGHLDSSVLSSVDVSRRSPCQENDNRPVSLPSSSYCDSIVLNRLDNVNLNSIDLKLDNMQTDLLVDYRSNELRDISVHDILSNRVSFSSSTSLPTTIETEAAEEDRKLLTSSVDKRGNTELHLKIIQKDESGALNIIKRATEFSDLNVTNKFGETPLHLAVLTEQGSVLRKLITAGAQVSERDNAGNTPLHLAAEKGFLDLARHLVTPIMYEETTENRYRTPFQAIPQNLSVENEDGYNCLELAYYNGHGDVLELLDPLSDF